MRPPSRGSKLVALALVAIVVAAGFGYWLFTPKMPSQIISATQQTSLATLPQQTTASTTLVPETAQWINVSASHPVGYYVSLLKSSGAQPYVELGWELQALPDATNATAVAKITYLALNATNPEVKEAFELMLKGGTPSPSDFTYSIPRYNTELQVLYWLACQNEFKKDDTLALAISMVNGLWVTMGDEQVSHAVRNDTTQLLSYFRETSELQRQRGYAQLETYPLEAQIALAWTGNECAAGFGENRPYRLFDYTNSRLGLSGYYWDTVSVETLRGMRALMLSNMWITKNADNTVANLEHYFYFDVGLTRSSHWNFTNPVRPGAKEEYVVIDGEKVLNHGHQNVNYIFRYYLQHNMGVGSCLDEEAFIDAWCKSWGIATVGLWLNPKAEGQYAHTYVSYYEPQSQSWRAYDGQLRVVQQDCFVYVYKMPVSQDDFLWTGTLRENPNRWDGGMVHILKDLTISQFKTMFSKGVPSPQMKQWLLYG